MAHAERKQRNKAAGGRRVALVSGATGAVGEASAQRIAAHPEHEVGKPGCGMHVLAAAAPPRPQRP